MWRARTKREGTRSRGSLVTPVGFRRLGRTKRQRRRRRARDVRGARRRERKVLGWRGQSLDEGAVLLLSALGGRLAAVARARRQTKRRRFARQTSPPLRTRTGARAHSVRFRLSLHTPCARTRRQSNAKRERARRKKRKKPTAPSQSLVHSPPPPPPPPPPPLATSYRSSLTSSTCSIVTVSMSNGRSAARSSPYAATTAARSAAT